MSHHDLAREFDTIVIGGGTGGAAFTGTLATHSTESLLLMESGPDF